MQGDGPRAAARDAHQHVGEHAQRGAHRISIGRYRRGIVEADDEDVVRRRPGLDRAQGAEPRVEDGEAREGTPGRKVKGEARERQRRGGQERG